ncbi:MAG: sulfatase [Planctomycetaceae bacterium]|nr:sulfatase [Planctomycetaceae bacterium]
MQNRIDPITSRREMLRRCGTGFGMLGLAGVLHDEEHVEAAARPNPLEPKATHFEPKAKRVVHLFMNGGPSQVDTFDHKPLLKKYQGQPMPAGNLRTERLTGGLMASPFTFRKYGDSGLEVSDLFRQTANYIDDMAVIRSMHAEVPNHEPSLMLMNCGDARLPRPSFGAWVTYGLGSENRNLPGFVAMCPGGYPIVSTRNWRSAFLPGAHQGTYIDTKNTAVEKLIANIKNGNLTLAEQRRQLDLVRLLNELHVKSRGTDSALEARIESFELAFRMQSEASDAFDISKESKQTQAAYGSGTNARQLLITRRLLERGVRFIQVWSGAGQPWDNHSGLEGTHRNLAASWDQPIAAFLGDLKQRGLLESTLVLWGGEFGRTPVAERPALNGRDHNHYGFTCWLAGGGVKGGVAHGATDDFGFRAVDKPTSVHDLHATMLHLLGLDHEELTHRYAGLDMRLTGVEGANVIDAIVA